MSEVSVLNGDSNIIYSGSWDYSESGRTVHSTWAAGSTASFSFVGLSYILKSPTT